MNSSASELDPAVAAQVAVSTEKLTVDLADGRTIHVPLAWYPRLAHASPTERMNWRLMGRYCCHTGSARKAGRQHLPARHATGR